MGAAPDTSVTACCTVNGAATKISFDAAEISDRIEEVLTKKLGKKGIAVNRTSEADSPQVMVRVVEIDQGNQLLRYLLPFISPAVLEVEGVVTAPDSARREFHYRQKAQIGLFGGSARGMLKVCADRVANKIARDVLTALGR